MIVAKQVNELCEITHTALSQLQTEGIGNYLDNKTLMIENLTDAILQHKLFDVYKIQSDDLIIPFERVNRLIDKILLIYIPEPKKLEKPVIDRIEAEKTDTKEIKKYIRKINTEIQSFTCDHNKFDKMFNEFDAQKIKIYDSKEFKQLKEILNSISSELLKFIELDDRLASGYFEKQKAEIINDNLLTEEEKRDYLSNLYEEEHLNTENLGNIINEKKIKEINDLVLVINKQCIELDAKFKDLQCHKCEHIRKLYAEAMLEIDEMRKERREAMELADSIENLGEDKFNVENFMTKHYPTVERVPMSDVCKKYKEVMGITMKQEDMKQHLEDTGKYKVTNVSHKLFIVKL